MKHILLAAGLFLLASCAELQHAAAQLPQSQGISTGDIASGLKSALNQGIDKQVSKLTSTDGFYKNPSVKILFPPELQKVERGLRNVGLGSLADEGVLALNRAAEQAVKEATPVFVNAVKQMSIADARQILMGQPDAATQYLERTTTDALYSKFSPVVQNALGKVGADKIWSNLISKYNALPLTADVNPDITDYVTKQALKGVYEMIAVEEKNIRGNLSARSSTLLQQVFALQDKK